MSFAPLFALTRALIPMIRNAGKTASISCRAMLLKHSDYSIYSAPQDVARVEFNKVIQMVCYVR
jgi:hypothetical protein